jgi:dTDP-4-dehydrorhamnose reductase
LLTGTTGQVGWELQQILSQQVEAICPDRTVLNLAQVETIQTAVEAMQPDLIVNPAAYTAVDRAEQETDLAHRINDKAAAELAQVAQRLEIPLVHLSTDYVFDGQQSSPYQEGDPTNPLGAYGRSKRAGEEAVGSLCDRAVIFRTAWVYGTHGKGNFVKTMLRLGTEREELRVVADQIGSPTWARDIAQAIAQLIAKLDADGYGTYHFTNSGVASWYDFAIAIFEEAEQLGWPLTVQRVVPITTADYPTPARRPAYSVLDCAKITKVLGAPPPHWRQSLRQMLRELYQQQV